MVFVCVLVSTMWLACFMWFPFVFICFCQVGYQLLVVSIGFCSVTRQFRQSPGGFHWFLLVTTSWLDCFRWFMLVSISFHLFGLLFLVVSIGFCQIQLAHDLVRGQAIRRELRHGSWVSVGSQYETAGGCGDSRWTPIWTNVKRQSEFSKN